MSRMSKTSKTVNTKTKKTTCQTLNWPKPWKQQATKAIVRNQKSLKKSVT